MKLLNSIHNDLGNRCFACWFASLSGLKSPYKSTVQRVCTRVIVGERFTVCSGAKNIPGMHIASQAPQLPPSFKFTFTLPPKNEKPLTTKKVPPDYIPPYFGFTASAEVVTAKNEKTANRLKITAVWWYRPTCVRLKPLPTTTLKISGSNFQKRRGHLDFSAVKCKNHSLALNYLILVYIRFWALNMA